MVQNKYCVSLLSALRARLFFELNWVELQKLRLIVKGLENLELNFEIVQSNIVFVFRGIEAWINL